MMVSRRSCLILGGLTLVSGAAAFGTVYLARADTARVLSPPEALEAALSGEILLVDIRRPDEWDATGMPQGSIGIDMRRDDFLEAVLAARATPAQPVAVICMRGVRSARVTRMFEAAGITSIIDVPEGMLGSLAGPGWLKRGLPVMQP
ncbi:rhodanese-like domain-containing protein [Dinoroseobacter sp. S76]|uniref:rhodanese-like domain-containing protein n=1 Tax=Dinoroseobacter sp. S76 TaxID=3415124 RepID=UPI003C7B4661